MLEIILLLITLLLWFIWRQLEQIAIWLQKLHSEAASRRPPAP
jgi:hypothetical protein